MIDNRQLKDKTSKVNWSELIIEAEANRDWFEEVTVTTLKSEYEETIYDMAWAQPNFEGQLDERAAGIMDSGEVFVSSYIQIDANSNVKICLDRDEVTDEVVEEALNILLEVNLGENTKTILGDKKTFTAKEMNLKL